MIPAEDEAAEMKNGRESTNPGRLSM